MTSLLTVSNIVKRYSGHVALDGVSLNIPKGVIYGLLGPNGAGKTSMIRIINQISAADEGEVLFEGEKLAPKHVEQIGYLPEERGLYKKMKTGEQALYFAQLKGMNKQDATTKLKAWFEKFQIMSWWDKKVEELSKGMQQKIQFIVTVIHEPKLLILDEPFSGFDPINVELIKAELLRLKSAGITIILSTHNMSSVEELCDNITLINLSKTVLEGNVYEIRHRYKESIWEITYAGDDEKFNEAVKAFSEIISSRQEKDYTITKLKINKGLSSNELLKSILPVCTVYGFSEVLPSMSDVFIAAVNKKLI
jgi:ABC-2 type transport system ATP-binding protein